MNYKRNVPDNALYLTSVGADMICLINLGSTTTFKIIASILLLALLSTSMISIECVLLKGNQKQELPPSPWRLGE